MVGPIKFCMQLVPKTTARFQRMLSPSRLEYMRFYIVLKYRLWTIIFNSSWEHHWPCVLWTHMRTKNKNDPKLRNLLCKFGDKAARPSDVTNPFTKCPEIGRKKNRKTILNCVILRYFWKIISNILILKWLICSIYNLFPISA